MRRPLNIIVIGFMISLTIGEIAVRLLAPAMPPVSIWPTAEMQLKSAQLSAITDPPDIIIIGSSTSQSSIDPKVLAEVTGLDTPYNAALPFSTMSSNLVWLEDVVLANTTPRLVIIGLPPWAPGRDDEELANVMREAAGWNESLLSRLSTLFRYRGVLADWDNLRARETLLESGLWTEAGHFTGYYERQLIGADPWVPPSRAEAMDPASARALEGMIERASESGARVALLVEPTCCRIDPNGGNREYLEWLQARAEDWGVPLWNSHSKGWPVDLFADSRHLNRTGTEIYTRYVGDLVSQSATAKTRG